MLPIFIRFLSLSLILVCGLLPCLAKQPAEQSPISLPQIAAKETTGRDLKIVKTLAQTAKYTRYQISYKSGNLKISGIMNVPKGTGPFPVLIFCHGYINPKVYTIGRGLKREQDYLAKQGFVVFHTDYRDHAFSDKDPLNENNFRLGYVEDAINAADSVKNSRFNWLDKNRIGMLGHSLGGGICLNIMTTKPELIKAFVIYSPVSADYIDNFNRWIKRDRHDIASRIMAQYGSPDAQSIFWKELSAINFIDRVQSPVMLNHGTADHSCPIAWSDKLAKTFRNNGKELVYYRYVGEQHEFGRDWSLFMARTADFFIKHLQ